MRKATDESATGLALVAEQKRLHKVYSSVRKKNEDLERNHGRQPFKTDDEGGHMKNKEEYVHGGMAYGCRLCAVDVLPDKNGKDSCHHWQIWRSFERRLMRIKSHASRRGALDHEWHDRNGANGSSRVIHEPSSVGGAPQEISA